ncbi:hypothetical protein FHG87_000451 [Trinorchestia longiramus]|nr:hypothetical protein FHG87_000451 [Trinorchestia longiramus]
MSSDVAIAVLLGKSRVAYCPCRAENFRAFHVIGSSGCLIKNCCQHYGFCVPANIDILDFEDNIGIVTLDTEALKQFLAARRPLPSCEPSTSPSTSTLSRATSLPPYHFESKPVGPSQSSSTRALQNPDPCPPRRSSLNVVHTWTPTPSQPSLARNRSDSELAATGRRGGGASPSSSHFDSSHHAFSQLMQTDDVSSIAEQIASQAELIYQTWKTTGLNPNQLIRYHSIATEDDVDSAPARCVTPVPRTPMRSISPAPPGSSPAVPRRVLDSSMTNGRQQQQAQQQFSSKSMQQPNSYQQLHQQPEKHRKDTPYIQQHYTQQFPSSQAQQQHYPNQQVQHLQNQSQHSSSPVRTLNASPRPYVSPNSPQTQGQASFRSASPSPPSVGYLHSNSPRPFVSSPPVSPPQPPERSSSYSGSDSPGDSRPVLSDPKVEVSLRDLVNTFVLEDKARQGLGTRLNERPKSAPSTIQDALQRFERQMAITARSTPPLNDERLHDVSITSTPMSSQYSPDVYSTSSPFSSSNSAVARYSPGNSGSSNETTSKRYTGSRSEPSITDGWQKSSSSNNPELDFRSRRSISPSPPPLAQPGWNETSQSSTSTWPLKFKQPSPGPQTSPTYSPSSISVSPPKNSPSGSTSNYVTTLETRVESPGSPASVASRHKVINLGPPTQEERILQSLRSSSLIQESEQKRLASQQSSRPNSNSSTATYSSSSAANSPKPKPKFSISVTVDVDEAKRPDVDNSSYRIRPEVSQMSTIDYAKVRFQEAQQHPKTAVRLQDERSISGPRNQAVNGDGRVLSVKNRFEPGEAMLRSFDPVLSTLPEFYRRKLRKMQRKSGSPEPLAGVLSTLPHPELTDQQKAHIRERSQSPTAAAFHAAAGAAAIRPFLTQGSVAERVMIFERAPVEMKPKPPSEISHLPQERRRPVLPYRDPDSVRSKAQFWNILHFLAELDNLPPSEETLSPPPSGGISPAIAAAVSTVSRHIEGSVPALPAPNDVREQVSFAGPTNTISCSRSTCSALYLISMPVSPTTDLAKFSESCRERSSSRPAQLF